MTKLEREIWEAAMNVNGSNADRAKAAAEVAKRYIEEAFDAGGCAWNASEAKSKWLKENGITS
jgi:hypothetical protein